MYRVMRRQPIVSCTRNQDSPSLVRIDRIDPKASILRSASNMSKQPVDDPTRESGAIRRLIAWRSRSAIQHRLVGVRHAPPLYSLKLFFFLAWRKITKSTWRFWRHMLLPNDPALRCTAGAARSQARVTRTSHSIGAVLVPAPPSLVL